MRRGAIGTFLGILGGVVLSAAPASVYASTIDLTTANAPAVQGTADQGGTFYVDQISPSSTGTGVIDSFLRIQQTGQERGYNTSLGTPLDDKAPADGFTRALLLSEVPEVILADGNVYYQFLLDINQNTGGSNEFLTLNQIQIFTASSDMFHTSLTEASGTTTAANIGFSGATEVFRMSGLTSADPQYQQIQLDYSLNAGSGSGDMFLYVLKTAFISGGTVDETRNVILFSQFGVPNGTSSSNDGFEEWAVLKGTLNQCVTCNLETTPEPASLMLLGSGLALAGARLRRKAARKA